MTDNQLLVVAVSVPAASRLAGFYVSTDLADAYAVALPHGASTDPETLARFIFSQQPRWAAGLMALRDLLVARFGLKTSAQLQSPAAAGRHSRIGIFRIYETRAHEIVLGEDDRHLDFRVSLLLEPQREAEDKHAGRVVLSTVVHCHNRLGRLYIALIAPFHRMIVKSLLRRAARGAWPSQQPAAAP